MPYFANYLSKNIANDENIIMLNLEHLKKTRQIDKKNYVIIKLNYFLHLKKERKTSYYENCKNFI